MQDIGWKTFFQIECVRPNFPVLFPTHKNSHCCCTRNWSKVEFTRKPFDDADFFKSIFIVDSGVYCN